MLYISSSCAVSVFSEDDFGSQWSLESLKDKIELYEFEKEETKIWREEHLVQN